MNCDNLLKQVCLKIRLSPNEGGLKLTNLFLFNRALKLCWVKRLVEGNGKWQKLFETMQGLNKKHMWQLDQQSLLDIEKRISKFFWRNVIAHWRYFITLHPYEVDLRKIPIFGSNLLNNDNLLMKRSSFEAEGLIYFNDLFDANGNLYGYENFVNSFAVNINFVDFYSLMHSIPRNYRTLDKIEIPHDYCCEPLGVILITSKVCKNTYQTMVSKLDFQRMHTEKWNITFRKVISNFDWEYYYSIIFKCTIDTKMRSFQYRLLLRAIVTNKYLYFCKLSQTDKCYFCEVNTETIEHLFWHCSIVKNFWFKVFEKFKNVLNVSEILKDENVLLGYKGEENTLLINHLLIIIKQYIYATKCLEHTLHTDSVLHKIEYHIKMEKVIAMRTDKSIDLYYKKWRTILSSFQTN